ncbi:hypothetical protein CCHR01_10020 [Colletotrichum chrysophilum]|uniref:Uncharacterized protein n=1 Tax=Colletotrichum chrysophilum TaxID=1836956 RepID=A0AAD9EJR7_9PEZI|nr:hypothetical protein CCHR01_10020 [Colletotrichum chrysophilum]
MAGVLGKLLAGLGVGVTECGGGGRGRAWAWRTSGLQQSLSMSLPTLEGRRQARASHLNFQSSGSSSLRFQQPA